jgi:integrase
MATRRGWRERVEPGLYRAHRLSCPRSADRRGGARCGCPWEFPAPGFESGRTRTVTFAGTLTEARAERRRLQVEGRPASPVTRPRASTLNDFAASYFRARAPVLAYNTVRSREYDYLTHIAPALGRLDLADVTRERVEVWLAGLAARSTSRRAVVAAVATLRVILGAAVEWGRLPANPALKLTLPPPEAREGGAERVLTLAQLRLLIASAGTLRTETLIRAAGEAGLRRGEIAGLRWPDVDLSARRAQIRRQVVQERLPGGGHRKTIAPTKGRRTRKAALSPVLAARLADWYAASVVGGGADAQGFVWPGRDGGPMHDRSAHRAVERACGRAGLVDASGVPLVGLHGLRHTAASVMLLAGVPLLVVSRQLGHASVDVTARVYAHLVDDGALDLAADAFSGDQVARTLGETLGEVPKGLENG